MEPGIFLRVSFRNSADAPFELRVSIPVNMKTLIGLPNRNGSSSVLVVDGQPLETYSRNRYLYAENIGLGAHTITCK